MPRKPEWAKVGYSKNRKKAAKDMMAMGYVWFFEHLHGKKYTELEREYGRQRQTIMKYVNKVANIIADAGKEQIMTELFPLAVKLYKAELAFQLRQYEEGRQGNISTADRLFKGLFILDHIQEHPLEEAEKGENEVESLEALMAIRTRSISTQKSKELPQKKNKELEKGEVIDAEIAESQAVDEKVAGNSPLLNNSHE